MSYELNRGDDGRYKIHVSDIRTFLRCRLKFQWSSRHGRKLEPKKTQKALFMGTGIHKSLERMYGFNDDPVMVWNKWCEFEKKRIEEENSLFGSENTEKIKEQEDLGEKMLEYYVDWSRENDSEYFNEIVSVEESFEVPIFTDSWNKSKADLSGRIDMVVKDRFDRIWLVEHKSYKDGNIDHLPQDLQVSAYSYAMKFLYGDAFEGTIFNVLVKDVPKKPKINKNGSVSKRKSKSLTKELYTKAIEEQNEDPEDYREVLEYIENNSRDFVVRKRVRRSDQELNRTSLFLYNVYRDMVDADVYPNRNKNCEWDCSFKEPCSARMRGDDYERFLDRLFIERESIHEKEDLFEKEVLEGI